MDYTIFYKDCFEKGGVDKDNYDIFLSAFDNCDRTNEIFNRIIATKKVWFIFPHYNLTALAPNPSFEVFTNPSYKEDDYFIEYFSHANFDFSAKICIDITGFVRPHLIYLIKYLYLKGVKEIDFLYTEPDYYKNAEETTFSGFIDEVKIIEGCGSAIVDPNTDKDLLITASGYDDKLIAKVSQHKSKIKNKYCILGFPSLQPDMYQESVLQIYNVKDTIGHIKQKYAPAYDPFVTAQVVDEIIKENPSVTNIYLSPLSTKPQTLGMALYYLWNYNKKPISIIFPYSKTYQPKTAVGIKNTWKYKFELP